MYRQSMLLQLVDLRSILPGLSNYLLKMLCFLLQVRLPSAQRVSTHARPTAQEPTSGCPAPQRETPPPWLSGRRTENPSTSGGSASRSDSPVFGSRSWLRMTLGSTSARQPMDSAAPPSSTGSMSTVSVLPDPCSYILLHVAERGLPSRCNILYRLGTIWIVLQPQGLMHWCVCCTANDVIRSIMSCPLMALEWASQSMLSASLFGCTLSVQEFRIGL